MFSLGKEARIVQQNKKNKMKKIINCQSKILILVTA